MCSVFFLSRIFYKSSRDARNAKANAAQQAPIDSLVIHEITSTITRVLWPLYK